MSDNPYEAPKSRVEDLHAEPQELAGRGARFGASLLDGLIMMAVLAPIEYASGFLQMVFEAARSHETLPMGTQFFWAVVGIVAFVVIQGYPLVTSGQTWGKKICSIKIVALDGTRPSLQHLGARYATYLLLGRIPLVGGLASIVNVLLIFRDDRRCGHDLAAGTRVVNA